VSACHTEGRVVTDGTAIALLGAPNAGKSSIFTHLTGVRVRTANYPGVTVTRSVGHIGSGDARVSVIDLPGTYGLEPVSPDEQLVADHIGGRLEGAPAPDGLLVVVDATSLRRSLGLIGQALGTGRPCAVALTMTDELALRGGKVDVPALRRALGVPVMVVIGHRGRGVGELRARLLAWREWSTPVLPPPADEAGRADWITSVLDGAGYVPAGPPRATNRIDDVVLHPVWGLVTFAAVMTAFFQTVFALAAPLQVWVEALLAWLGEAASAGIGHPVLADFVRTALLGGLGGVLVFLPQIVLLFLLLSLLESVGYLSRAAVLMDRVMALSGLDGRAFVAMLSSVACAVPGIMATRTMPSSRDRLTTMLAAPLMPCAARLPVYVLLVGMLVPAGSTVGPFGAKGLAMLALYVLGGLSAMGVALLLRTTALRDGGLPFYLELPPYRVPTLRTVVEQVWSPTRTFLRKVGTIILAATVVLWGLMTFPMRDVETASMDGTRAAAYTLDHSYAADLGRAVEPVFAPLGFDWRIDVGLVGALAAREVFVSTLGQVAAAENPADPHATLADLTLTSGPRTGEPLFTAPTTVALLVFFVYALQCVSTLAVLRRESSSWRWPVVAFAGFGVLAWVMAWVARTITAALV
jgi:ferrous iron transport protein B